jgi:hypothetical protein
MIINLTCTFIYITIFIENKKRKVLLIIRACPSSILNIKNGAALLDDSSKNIAGTTGAHNCVIFERDYRVAKNTVTGRR